MTTDPFTEATNDAAREYARTPRMNVGTVQDRIGQAHADGWEAARTHLAVQEPTEDDASAAYIEWDRHVAYGERGALRCHCGAPGVWGTTAAHEQHALWHALRAARAARRDDTSTTPEQRIRTLHAPDADRNCGQCTRGRVYPVPAPCETVRALARGGEGR